MRLRWSWPLAPEGQLWEVLLTTLERTFVPAAQL